jgi:hypothetical protein
LPSSPQPPQDFSTSPLHTLSQAQLDQHLRYLSTAEPDPAARLQRLAEQSIGQPFQANTLGEGTYDSHDARPLYALDRSDSASFVEQTLAMAVAPDFEAFFLTLQRLRYKDGQVSTATRNHNLLADWSKNNGWLLDDITEQLAGGMAWVPVHQIVRRKAFLQQQYGVTADVPDEKFVDSCIPRVYLHKVLAELRPGDVILVITGNDRQQFCTEMGILLDEPSGGDYRHRLVQSQAPAVRKRIFRWTVWQRKEIMGFKFLRLRADAVTAAAQQANEMRTRIALP